MKNAESKVIKISALKKQGIEEIYNEIERLFSLNEISLDNSNIITNVRHKEIIKETKDDINKAFEGLNNKDSIDAIEVYIREGLNQINKITGESASEEIIKEIFSKFCLGK